ncbi:MAG: cell division protein FtsZ [Candidatus Parvarchaeum acidiphilum ARMAN-4]|jgi:cell division protein FtsZ|uniref:Cell division protein FtsZ n=1 Tax=Candidatus Parvarchaeum acidiphilum ARMAN-4 TaxID=662760 RepID=D2EFD1_PARA4|nr:MAG: cell division protein FtsZ [Candidatus Parvarchaeum acidiphilum ARMAN-4]
MDDMQMDNSLSQGIKGVKYDSSKTKEFDKSLEELIASRRANIKVVGVGGSGNNTLNRMFEVGIKGAEFIAVNTDAADLLCTPADKKILIGKELTNGLGAGADPSVGEAAAKEQEQEIKEAIQGADLVFICCGMGGGTGTGAAPVVASVAKKINALTIAVVTLPFKAEGRRRMNSAVTGVEKLKNTVDTLITVPNEKLMAIAPGLPLPIALKIADDVLTNAVKGITELITKAGLINVDFADVKRIMSNGGVALIGTGESDAKDKKLETVVEKVLNNPLIDVDVSTAKGMLIDVSGGPSLTLEEANKLVDLIGQKLPEDINIIWGAHIFPDLKNTVKVLAIITGVTSKQISGKSIAEDQQLKEKREVEDELGITFLS